MATTTLKVNAAYSDGDSRIYTFGPFDENSAKLDTIVETPVTLAGLKNFLKYTVSDGGGSFASLSSAQVVSGEITEINLN